MSFMESFLPEFDVEMAATRKMLERLPSDRLAWKPHGKSKSLSELATHLAELPRFGLRIQKDEFAVGSEKAPAMTTATEFLARFDENVRASREAIARMTDADLERDFTVTLSSQIARVEVPRALRRAGAAAGWIRRAEDVLARLALLRVENSILARASGLEPSELRSLAAIHLATALSVGNELEVFVCYDRRLSEAARRAGLSTVSPSEAVPGRH